jgi:hypothetical protein
MRHKLNPYYSGIWGSHISVESTYTDLPEPTEEVPEPEVTGTRRTYRIKSHRPLNDVSFNLGGFYRNETTMLESTKLVIDPPSHENSQKSSAPLNKDDGRYVIRCPNPFDF